MASRSRNGNRDRCQIDCPLYFNGNGHVAQSIWSVQCALRRCLHSVYYWSICRKMHLLTRVLCAFLLNLSLAWALGTHLVSVLGLDRDPLAPHFEISWVLSGIRECSGAIIFIWDSAVFYSAFLGANSGGVRRSTADFSLSEI